MRLCATARAPGGPLVPHASCVLLRVHARTHAGIVEAFWSTMKTTLRDQSYALGTMAKVGPDHLDEPLDKGGCGRGQIEADPGVGPVLHPLHFSSCVWQVWWGVVKVKAARRDDQCFSIRCCGIAGPPRPMHARRRRALPRQPAGVAGHRGQAAVGGGHGLARVLDEAAARRHALQLRGQLGPHQRGQLLWRHTGGWAGWLGARGLAQWLWWGGRCVCVWMRVFSLWPSSCMQERSTSCCWARGVWFFGGGAVALGQACALTCARRYSVPCMHMCRCLWSSAVSWTLPSSTRRAALRWPEG